MFYEFGKGPRKYAAGEFKERLYIRQGPQRPKTAKLILNNETLNLVPYDNLYFQVSTRGRREMDYILRNKAVFKSTVNDVAETSLGLAAGIASDDSTAIAEPFFSL